MLSGWSLCQLSLILNIRVSITLSSSCYAVSGKRWGQYSTLMPLGSSPTYTTRTSSIVLPRLGVGAPLPSAADGEGQGQLSPLPQVVMGQGGKADCPCHHMADKEYRSSTHHDLIADSPMPPSVGSALLCFPGEVYRLLFQERQPERGKIRSPVFLLSGLALPPTTGGEEQERGRASTLLLKPLYGR